MKLNGHAHAFHDTHHSFSKDEVVEMRHFLTTAGVPVIVELGASLDILFAVLILGVLTGRLRHTFGNTDLDLLRELHD